MTADAILPWLAVITGILVIIEKLKFIPLKPLTWLFTNTAMSKRLDDIYEAVNSLTTRFNSKEREDDLWKIENLKAYILEFANQKCEQGIKMTSEQERNFDNWCIAYEKLIEKNNIENGQTTQSIKMVSDYRKMELADKYKNNVRPHKEKVKVYEK